MTGVLTLSSSGRDDSEGGAGGGMEWWWVSEGGLSNIPFILAEPLLVDREFPETEGGPNQ